MAAAARRAGEAAAVMRASGAASSVGGGGDGAGDAAGGGTRPVMMLGGTPNIMTWQKWRRADGISAARQAGEAPSAGAIGTVGGGDNGGGGAGDAAGGGISHVMVLGGMPSIMPWQRQWRTDGTAAAARWAGEALGVDAVGTVGGGDNGGGGAGGAAGGGISPVMMLGAPSTMTRQR